jgi:hypothetical protein
VVRGDKALVFDFDLFADNIRIMKVVYGSQSILIVRSRQLSFVAAYLVPVTITFNALNGKLPGIMEDNAGNTYDLMGNITQGPNKGERLKSPFSYTAKNFAWELFFDLTLYE